MVYFYGMVSALVTGGVFAVGAQLLGVREQGIVVAIGIIAGGAQLLALVVWYLFRTRPKAAPEAFGERGAPPEGY